MMCKTLKLVRKLNRYWYVWLLVLIVSTILFAVWGDIVKAQRATRNAAPNSEPFDWMTSLYQAMKLFMLDSDGPDFNQPWQANLAYLLGFIVWLSAISAVVIRLFEQPFLRSVVAMFARRHVVIAGLGNSQHAASRLVINLLRRGHNVVVIESNREHSGLSACRDAGAVILFGLPTEETQLKRAQAPKAQHLLCLFHDDRDNLEIATVARELIHKARTSPKRDPPRCVIQIKSPALIEAVRKHRISDDHDIHFRTEVLSVHEITTRAMLREAVPRLTLLYPKKILILGTGARGRLGETLVLRAAKDWWVDHYDFTDEPGSFTNRISIDVYDRDAGEWLKALEERYPLLAKTCNFKGRSCVASRCGFRAADNYPGIASCHYDAIFICLANEADALVQANRIAEQFANKPKSDRPPIVVRVEERDHGCGKLLSTNDAGGLGWRILPVGISERVFDVDTVLSPESEMLAQAMHEEYLRKVRVDILKAEEAGDETKEEELRNRPAVKQWHWDKLAESYRQSNRELAARVEHYLAVTHTQKKSTKYAKQLMLSEFTAGRVESLFNFNDNEIEFLAELEHERWMNQRKRQEYSYGPERDDDKKLTPYLLPWDNELLPEEIKDYDREFIRRLPRVMARADYRIVEIDEKEKPTT